MKIFEYKVIGSLFIDKEDLNKLGIEGWELVTIYHGEFYFKREVENN